MSGGSGGGGKGGRTNGGGSGDDNAAQIAELKAELDRIEKGKAKIDEEMSKLSPYKSSERPLYDRLDTARTAADDKIRELDNKIYELKPKMPLKDLQKIADSREKSEAAFQAKFWKEKATAAPKPIKKLKKERLYDDPGATNSWNEYY